ncbi:mucin-5AC-like [Sycon ciliatum]|uniref:mucin-5AC-like n=1 Tax=Sycon ciliatum TaxID=27933 RepID=UPI0031F690DA
MIGKPGARDAGRGRGRRGGGSRGGGSHRKAPRNRHGAATTQASAPQREELESNVYRYEEPEPSLDDEFDEEMIRMKDQRHQDNAKLFSALLDQPVHTALHQHRQETILPEADIGVDLNALAKNLCSIPVHTRLDISEDHLSSTTIAEFQRSASESVKSSTATADRLVRGTEIAPAPIQQYIARARNQDLSAVADTAALSNSSIGERKSMPQSDHGPRHSAPTAHAPVQQVSTPQQCGPDAEVDGKDGDDNAVLDALLALPTAPATPAAVTSTNATTAPARARDQKPAPNATNRLQTGSNAAHCAPTASPTSVLVESTTASSPSTAATASSGQNRVSSSSTLAKPTTSASMEQRVANKGAPVAALGAGPVNVDTVATSKRAAAVAAAAASADDHDDELDFLLAL